MYRSVELLLFTVFFLCLLPAVHSHIWAWMLSIPYNVPDETALPRSTNPPASFKGPAVVCDHDRGCRRGSFCDKHFGLCVLLRNEGQYCRKDTQCSRGLYCMFGKCHHIVPEGHEGSRCKLDKNCGPSMCCARHHGEMICKKRLTLGESCYIPEGGLAFSINQVCPCEEGLVCKNTEPQREKEFQYWKCQKPST
uniref:Dickkopf N-terminal cysteine-rich domain-containing protein n=1 Tax=Latimeria chalumnae TaxID=7897 RepID=H3AQX4_LATCH